MSTRPRNTHVDLGIAVGVRKECKEVGDLLEIAGLSEKSQNIIYTFLEAGEGSTFASWLRDMTEDFCPYITETELNTLIEDEGEEYFEEIKA